MADNKVITGAIAIVKVGEVAVGKMRDIRINETYRRLRVSKGLGSIYADEQAVTEFDGTLTCSFYEIDFNKSGMLDRNGEGAVILRRKFKNGTTPANAAFDGVSNFEDQLVLDDVGIDVVIYKKMKDLIDPDTGLIRPKAVVYAVVKNVFIETDNINIAEGQVGGRDQSFKYLVPVVTG